MITSIWLLPAIPLLSFLIIALFSTFMSKRVIALLGAGSVILPAIITAAAGVQFFASPPEDGSITSTVYTWMNTGGFTAGISFLLDPLSLVFCFVITFVGALIHIYSIEFMKEDEGFARFFSYMNLFVGSMLILVLADNLLLLYLGWEGVGLCSYLLIGFWYKNPENGYAARKAFIITRIGDTAMILGLFLLFVSFDTADIQAIMKQVPVKWPGGSPLPVIASLLLLGGALGKSAQLPLQTWLPDAMAGPSPVSALIHAATMVTAGVYLITRTHVLFAMAPVVMAAVAVTGAVTLLVAGFSALAQTDLKRVLAYSTISQIGYMFLAMGIGAWSAAIFHFMIHAFFKALLFLSAGAVIHLLHDEHDMLRMGGLRKRMPVVFFTFLAGAASLAALPLVTAGSYSKDEILWFSWSSATSNHWLWLAGFTGALLTSLYTFRMVFITFFGEEKTTPDHKPGLLITIPLVVLAALSLAGGFIEMPENIGPVKLFSKLFNGTLPHTWISEGAGTELMFQILSAVVTIGGVYLAWILFAKNKSLTLRFHKSRLISFFYSGWNFDRLYNFLFVKPTVWLAETDKNDFTDHFYSAIARITVYFNASLSMTQNGKLRWYVLVLTIGIAVILTIMVTV